MLSLYAHLFTMFFLQLIQNLHLLSRKQSLLRENYGCVSIYLNENLYILILLTYFLVIPLRNILDQFCILNLFTGTSITYYCINDILQN